MARTPRKKSRTKIAAEVQAFTEAPERHAEPAIDANAVAAVAKELTQWQELHADSTEYLGPLVNCLWRLDCALNPDRRAYGHNRRDEKLATAPPVLHLARQHADKLIVRFGLERAITSDDPRAMIKQAAESLERDTTDVVHDESVILPQLHLDELPPDAGKATARRRNVLFAIWKQWGKLTVADVRDRWNGLEEADRRAVSPRNFEGLSFETTKKAITKGKRERKAITKGKRERPSLS